MAQAGNVEFIQYTLPGIKDGLYKLELSQPLKGTGSGGAVDTTLSGPSQYFAVLGQRFSLTPQTIMSAFPPPGNLGDHYNVLPHVMLASQTLPWERYSKAGDDYTPWLALLLFDEDEKPTPQVITVADLLTNPSTVKFPQVVAENASPTPSAPYLELEPGDHTDDKLTVIDVPKSLLDGLIPDAAAAALLAHVRQAKTDDDAPDGSAFSTVVANRLPKPGGTSTLHLVSLEGRYDSHGQFNWQSAGDADQVRLVSLYSWSFACEAETEGFRHLLLGLDRGTATLTPPAGAEETARKRLGDGYVPLPAALREGSQTYMWYHGPLAPNQKPITLLDDLLADPVTSSDQLLLFDEATGMVDASYAAAWELGRLMGVQSKHFSTNLYLWKRQRALDALSASNLGEAPHLPFAAVLNPSEADPDLPEALETWLYNLALLKGVPFHYLVPDAHLLPPESIRFFVLDRVWLATLLEGAFSLGRTSQHDTEMDQKTKSALSKTKFISGVLIRSQVVSGWPHLLVDCYAEDVTDVDVPAQVNGKAVTPLLQLRFERLAPDVLLVLVEGDTPLQTVDVHQKPEVLHFGVDDTLADGAYTFWKQLRNPDTGEQDGAPKLDSVPLNTRRVMDIATLSTHILNQLKTHFTIDRMDAAPLALQMIEGVELVRFSKGT